MIGVEEVWRGAPDGGLRMTHESAGSANPTVEELLGKSLYANVKPGGCSRREDENKRNVVVQADFGWFRELEVDPQPAVTEAALPQICM